MFGFSSRPFRQWDRARCWIFSTSPLSTVVNKSFRDAVGVHPYMHSANNKDNRNHIHEREAKRCSRLFLQQPYSSPRMNPGKSQPRIEPRTLGCCSITASVRSYQSPLMQQDANPRSHWSDAAGLLSWSITIGCVSATAPSEPLPIIIWKGL